MNDEQLAPPEWKDLKDIYLAKKQGEALERSTRPASHYEALGLGDFGPQTNLALSALDAFEDVLNELIMMGMTKLVEVKDKDNNVIGKIEVSDVDKITRFQMSQDFRIIHTFTEEIGVASGSNKAIRLEKGLETIGQLGQYFPSLPGIEHPQPTLLTRPGSDSKDKKKGRIFNRDG